MKFYVGDTVHISAPYWDWKGYGTVTANRDNGSGSGYFVKFNRRLGGATRSGLFFEHELTLLVGGSDRLVRIVRASKLKEAK